MKVAESIEPGLLATNQSNIIQMPVGLLGFEKIKQYAVLADPEEAPFIWLETLQEPKMAFLVICPTGIIANYQPDIGQEDVAALNLRTSEEALILNIVTMFRDGSATINLKGPIVINRRTRVAKQVVPFNAAEFSVQHPLPLGNAVMP